MIRKGEEEHVYKKHPKYQFSTLRVVIF